MGIILKYTLKSITEHKFRTFLILLSISLSVALSLASFALRDVTRNAIVEMVKKYMGTANVMVTGEESKGTSLVRIADLGDKWPYFEYQIGAMQTSATYRDQANKQTINFAIRGYEEADIDTLGVANLTAKSGDDFDGRVMYMSQTAAKEYGWQLGQTIELFSDGLKYRVKIAGLGSNSGALEYSNGTVNALMPASALRKIFNTQDRYFYVILKTREGVDVNQAMTALREVYPRYKVDEPIPWSQIEGMLNNIIVPFIFMLLLVLATAVFIIFTAFKVITTEKLPVLGTFRSIGATKRTVDFILLAESFIYGLIGAGFGVLLGRGLLGLVGNFMAQNMNSGGTLGNIVNVNPMYYVGAVIFGILLSVFSSLMPILKVSNLSVRDIVLGFTSSFKDRSVRKMIIGLVMLTAGLLIPYLSALNGNLILNLLATVLLCAGLINLVPTLTWLLIRPLALVGRLIFGNLGMLSVKNINGNKSVIDNISLLTIGIASILLINILSATISSEVSQAFKAARFNVYAEMQPLDRGTILKVKNTAGVTAVYPIRTRYGTEVVDANNRISQIDGARGMDYFDYWDFDIVSDRAIIEQHLGTTRAIVLSTTLKKQLNVDVGDAIILKMREQKDYAYTVVGFFNALNNNGSFAVATDAYLKRDSQLGDHYDTVLIKTDTPDQTAARLNEVFSRRESRFIKTTAQLEEQNKEQNAVMINIFRGFSVIAMVIGTFGILNNFIVSLLSRQRSLAVMKSVGMSRRQTFGMLIIEAAMSGVIGGIAGMIGGVLLTLQVNQFFTLLNVPFTIVFMPSVLLSGFVAGVVISVLSSLLPARNVSRMNIVNAIKYE